MSPLLRKSVEQYKAFGVSLMARLKAISFYEWKYKNSIKSHTILLRADGAQFTKIRIMVSPRWVCFIRRKVLPILLLDVHC